MGFRGFAWLLFLAALWGPSFLFIKVAVAEIPPMTIVLARVGLAAALLYLLLRLRGRRLPAFGPAWGHFAVMGVMTNAVPFWLFCWGEQYVASALAAILNGSTPLFALLLAHWFVPDDRMTRVKALGAAIGFAGLAATIAPAMRADGLAGSALGALAIALAAAFYGAGFVYARLFMRGFPPLVAPTAQLAIAALILAPICLAFERPFALPAPSWRALGSVIALATIGTALALAIYYWLVERLPPSSLSMVTYLIPIFGVAIGAAALGERLDWHAAAGCGLILLGVAIVNGVFKIVWIR